jgi:hypothetical protein
MKKYKEVCNKLKGKEVKMSNVRSALLEIAGGSRDVLLQIKVEAQEKEQLSTGLLAGASLLVAVVTMSITCIGVLIQVLLQYSKGDSDMLIMLLFLASVLYFILLAVDILKAIVRSFISRNEVKWNRYVLIEIEDLLQTELFKAKEIKKKQKR